MPEDSDANLLGTDVSDMQEDIEIKNGEITGILKYLSTGIAAQQGAGNYIALKFVNNDENAVTVKVGLNPSTGSGLQTLGEDMNGVFKITDKNEQKFIVETYDINNNLISRKGYDLSKLNCLAE